MTNDHVVVSADGTRIAASRDGSGPPIVFVHGAIGDRTSFRFVAPLLAERFEGQGHMATVTAPELLAAAITRFVEER